jgi:hypothetical protein
MEVRHQRVNDNRVLALAGTLCRIRWLSLPFLAPSKTGCNGLLLAN